MKRARSWQRSWVRRVFFGAALGLGHAFSPLHAAEPPQRPVPIYIMPDSAQTPTALAEPSPAASCFSPAGAPGCCDPCAPAWCDPVSRVPNFFGDFFGRGSQACGTSTRFLTYTGGGEGNPEPPPNTAQILPLGPVTGPGGPYTLTTLVTGTGAGPSFFAADENTELTGLVRANFPGASFLNGTLFVDFSQPGPRTFLLNYLFSQDVCVNLPNPAGGGLVGRNEFFDNGTALPHDRVYFFYNHVGNFERLGTPLEINRYVFGAEKTFLDGYTSIEVRIPFAGTANSDQVAGQGLAVSNAELGNFGLAFKAVVYRTPNFVASVGLGLSLPSADDSRMLFGEIPVIAIENRTCILQPLLGIAWAPNDRFYAQAGVQFDFDPSGNPVKVLNASGGLSRIGVLTDQNYAFVNSAAGYWVYQNKGGCLSAVAMQGELDFATSLGSRDTVQTGTVTVADLDSSIDVLNGAAGAIFQFGERTNLSIGMSFPLGGEHLYDWNLVAQLNFQFGGPR